jgi:hypothetical protein
VKDEDALANPAVPASAGATDGATQTSLGDCSMADLKRGYCPCEHEYADEGYSMRDRNGDTSVPRGENKGFLTRPYGWER